MTLKDLKELLEQTGYQVAYRVFSNKTQVSLPFIAYLESSSNNFMADNKVYKKIETVQVELYTSKKDEIAQNKLETLFIDNEIPYESIESYLNDEKVYLITYDIQIHK